jgi:hypothetical protein
VALANSIWSQIFFESFKRRCTAGVIAWDFLAVLSLSAVSADINYSCLLLMSTTLFSALWIEQPKPFGVPSNWRVSGHLSFKA